MAVTNEPTLNRKHDLELSLELLSFAGGENTISEDHVCKADEARVVENWDSVSLGGMERSKGFNRVADADASGIDSYTTLLLHADGTNDSETITDSSSRANTVTNVGNSKIKTAVKKFGTGSLLLNGTTQYATVPSDQKLTNGSFETWTGLTDLLTNGNMETASPPSSWTLTGAGATWAREATIIKEGIYSGKLTRSGANCYVYQVKGSLGADTKTYVLGAWVYQASGAANRAGMFIALTGGTPINSTAVYHSGVATGWEYLTVTLTNNGTNTSSTIYLLNYTTNGDVYFDSVKFYEQLAPTGWNLSGTGATVAREEGTIKVGSYAAKLTRNGANAQIYQNAYTALGSTAIRGKTITFGCWVYATVASRAKIGIYDNDGAGGTSSFHSGTAGWEYLTVTATIGSGTTVINIYCYIQDGDTTAYFDGAFVTDDAAANFNFGSGDFTIDTWVRFSDLTGVQSIFFHYLSHTNPLYFTFHKTAANKLQFIDQEGATVLANYSTTSAISFATDTWYHLELVRSGTSVYIFVDGVSQTLTATTPISTKRLHNVDDVWEIGAWNGGNFLNGYLDEFRVSKGIARHTADFTPPTSPYRVAYAGSYDLLVQHDDVGGTETYAVIEGNLLKKASTRMDLEDSGAFTSGILCHAVSVKDNGLYITNATDGLKLKTVGNAISVPSDVPPSACARIYNHKNRLLAEGSETYSNRVYGSRVGKGNWDEADAWTLANDAWSIDLPEDTRGLVPDFPSGDYVLAFTDKNAYALGNFPNTSFRAIGTPARGCSAPYSIAKGDEGVYFASVYPTKGIFLFDGTSFQELTELNHDVFTDKIDFTKRIFGIYRNRRYHIWYNETGSGVTYPNAYRIYDARFKRWMERPINSAVADNFGYPALLNYASWELYNASSRTNYVYELETEDNSDEGENTEAVYTTKSFSSRDFAVAAGGQFPIDDCRMKLLKLTINFYGEVGAVGFYWSADRGLHSGSKTIDLNQTGDMLNTTFILNSSSINATPQEKTRSYTFPNDAVGKRFYFQITNSGTSTRPKIKKIKVSALAFPEP